MLQEIQLVQGHNNCVVVSTGYNGGSGIVKSTIEKRFLPIAPAMNQGENMNMQTADMIKCKKKINYKSNPYTGPQAASIARRNARERNRVKQVNDGFAALRRHLPASVVAALSNGAKRGTSKKLSKVDTLRMVVEYIRYLQQLLDENDENQTRTSYTNNESSMNDCSRLEDNILTSPYTELPPSPSPSETSSGVSSGYYRLENQDLSPMQEDELLDVISWWQQK